MNDSAHDVFRRMVTKANIYESERLMLKLGLTNFDYYKWFCSVMMAACILAKNPEELAKSLRLSHSTVKRWAHGNGGKLPSRQSMKKLVAYIDKRLAEHDTI